MLKFNKSRPGITEALVLMCPGAPFVCEVNPETNDYDYEHVVWQTKGDWTPPSKADVLTYMAKIQREWDEGVLYQLARKQAYPDVGAQLDALWHAMDDNILPRIEPMYSDIKAVKEGFAKGDTSIEFIANRTTPVDMNPAISPPDIVKPYTAE